MNATDPASLSALQAGLLHPLMIPAHVVALLGLGLMIGQQTRRLLTLMAFAAGLAAGLAALAHAVGETPALTVLLAAAAVAGLAAAVGWSVPTLLAAPLALVIGVCVGLDSPPKVAAIQAANVALVGTGLGAFAGVAVIAAIAARLRRRWLRIGIRVLGSWVAASAILVIALRLVR